tara:strand:+ start:62 stop:271 length:210 start_codon:yes stop_codon:yes gene_type:complete
MDHAKRFKYIIIQKDHNEIVLKNSYRDISVFINLIYPDKKISHNSVGERLRKDKFFDYYDLIVKELIWK